MTLVEEKLREKVDELFLELQDLRKIKDGDLSPNLSIILDDKIELLAEHIEKCLDYQTPSFNMSATVELLEDFHCFKRGEVVYVNDSTDTHYISSKDNVFAYYIPQDKCRRID